MRTHRAGLLSCLGVRGTSLWLVSVVLGLSGFAQAQVASLNPTSLNFGNQQAGTTSAPMPVTLTNTGTAALTINAISIGGGIFAETNNCPVSLAISASCNINVKFMPNGTGGFSGTLTIKVAKPATSQTVQLSGKGVPPSASLSPSSLSFGEEPVGGTSTAQAVTLSNSSPGSFTITGITIGGMNPGAFVVQTDTCANKPGTPPFPASLAAGASCTINIAFKPTGSAGAKSATLFVTIKYLSSSLTVSLGGTETATPIPPAITSANSTMFTVGKSGSFTVTATGSPTPTLSSSPLPAGVTFAPATGVLSGMPSVAGAFNITFTATSTAGTVNQAFTLTVNKGTATVTLSNLTQTYTGSPLTPTATTTPSGLAIIWTNAPDINAGSYNVTATVNDPNYIGSASNTFVITRAVATVVLSNLTQTFTGSPLTPTATTAPAGLPIMWTGAPDTNVGTYAVTATVNSPNYTAGSASGSFVINKAAATVTLNNLTQTYTGSALTPTVATSPTGLSTTLSGAPDTNVGTYPVTATVTDPNYTGTASGSFVINKAAATVTLGNLTQIYTGSALSPTVTTVPASLATSLSGAPDTNVGTYSVTATVTDPNYTGSTSGSFVINPAAATVALSNMTQTYTGGALTPTATTTPSGLSITWTGAPDTNAGTYSVTATVNNPNYTGSASGSFVISPAAATVTANAASKVYGSTDPILTASETGFTAADAATIVLSATRAAGENVGTYTITPSATGPATANYNITYQGTNFTITQATPAFGNLTASQFITFGTASINLTGTIAAGTVYPPSGETVGITINGSLTSATIGANGSFSAVFPTGTIPASTTPYGIAYSYAGDTNFAAASDTSTSLTVNQASGTLVSITITPANSSIALGGTLSLTATGNNSDTTTQNLTSSATWSSSATTVATVTAGVLTAASSGCGGPVTITATSGTVSGSTVMTVSVLAGFACGANMTVSRNGHTATMLPNGLVLIAGGVGANGLPQASAELYNPATGTSTSAGNMTTPRTNHTATLLNTGQVLIIGGQDATSTALNSSELYDPIAGTFTASAYLNFPRYLHTATLLGDGSGTAAVVGGRQASGDLNSIEIFDPVAQVFTIPSLFSNLTVARDSHTATPNAHGFAAGLLIAGGFSNGTPTNVPEIYDVNCSCTYQALNFAGRVAFMQSARAQHTATLVSTGNVLFAGGAVDASNTPTNSAEEDITAQGIFEPSTNNLDLPRFAHSATALTNNLVLIAGGNNFGGSPSVLNTADLYDPASDLFSSTQSLNTARLNHTATLLSCNCAANGWVFVAGGTDSTGAPLQSTELYQPASLAPSGLTSIQLSPLNPTLQLGQSVQFSASGMAGSTALPLAAVTWTSSNNAILEITSDTTNSGFAIPVSPGSATVSACTGTVCAMTPVTVTSVVGDFSLSASPNPLSAQQGSSNPITLTVNPLNGFTNNVTFSISALPSGVTASFSGNPTSSNAQLTFTVQDTAALATTSITVTGTSANVSHTLQVYLTVISGLNFITVTPSNPFIVVPPVTPEQFTATGNYLDGNTLDLTPTAAWSSSNTNVATIASGGVATLATQVSGTTTITATDPSGVSGSTTLTVTDFSASQLATPPAPARGCMGMVFVPQDMAGNTNYTLIFGGCPSQTGRLGDTWMYSRATGWTQLSPSTSPSVRSGPGMAYDANTKSVVLFGGTGLSGDLNDTWTWDGTNWTNVTSASSPAPRRWGTQGMTYDATNGNVVLFGGVNATGSVFYNDTWTWNGSIWIQQSTTTSPSARRAPLAYDPATGNVVLFGGEGSYSGPTLGDTWTWDGTNWTQQSPANSPPVRSMASMAYDASNSYVTSGHLVLFGGSGAGSNPPFLNDTWIWDGATWTQVYPATPPPVRYAFGMIFDPLSGILVYGGLQNNDTVFLGDLWVLAP